MILYRKSDDISCLIKKLKDKNQTIGLVPTMGALHQGHLSLILKALEQNHTVVVSIFVNPTQFNNKKDYNKYPRTIERDLKFLEPYSKHLLVFNPTVDSMYNGNTVSKHFDFEGIELVMEGKFRKGHFNGVGTIVKRLFEIIKPHNAYFGEKDFQQLVIIKKLVKQFNLPINIVGCEICREIDGLAMSSRNERLTPDYRAAAPFIFQILTEVKLKFKTENISKINNWVKNQFDNHELLKLEYFNIADIQSLQPIKQKNATDTYRAFIAVFADDIRLIDNVALN